MCKCILIWKWTYLSESIFDDQIFILCIKQLKAIKKQSNQKFRWNCSKSYESKLFHTEHETFSEDMLISQRARLELERVTSINILDNLEWGLDVECKKRLLKRNGHWTETRFSFTYVALLWLIIDILCSYSFLQSLYPFNTEL